MSVIRNIIFDIGNVLVSFQPRHYYKDVLKEACETVCDAVFASSCWDDYDNGLCTLEEVKQQLLERHPDLRQEIALVIDDWFHLMKPIPAMWELREECRERGYGIYIISNLSRDSYEYLQREYHLFDALDGRVLSFEERFGKPDARMFTRLCERCSLLPSECLFLDDHLPNIEAAERLGMHTVHVSDPEAAAKEARERLC